jgi:hypothetical protein
MERRKDICLGCDHFCYNNDDKLGMGCRAFYNIPDKIGGLNSHDKPTKIQENDFVYMPAKRKIGVVDGVEIEIYQDSNPYADENGRYNGK